MTLLPLLHRRRVQAWSLNGHSRTRAGAGRLVAVPFIAAGHARPQAHRRGVNTDRARVPRLSVTAAVVAAHVEQLGVRVRVSGIGTAVLASVSGFIPTAAATHVTYLDRERPYA